MNKDQIQATLEKLEDAGHKVATLLLADRRRVSVGISDIEFDDDCEMVTVVTVENVTQTVAYDTITSIAGEFKPKAVKEQYNPWNKIRGVHTLRMDETDRVPYEMDHVTSIEEVVGGKPGKAPVTPKDPETENTEG